MHTKTKRAIKDFSNKKDSEFQKLTEVIFSSALSLFLTYLAETYFTQNNSEPFKLLDIILLFVGGIILYCVLYVCIRKVYSIISKKIEDLRYNKQINSPDISAQKNKELIDDFDHVAFDNLIAACELLEEIKASDDIEVRTFCFHEVIYYLKIAIKKTKEVTHPNRREECLNIFGNANGIDIFRLYNIYKIMHNIHAKINDILQNNAQENTIQEYDENLKTILDFQIKEIGDDVEKIKILSEDAKNDINPRN